MKIAAKFFPFAARQPLWDMAKKHGKMKYTIVAIWDYMYWRSGKKNLFELAEELVCLDLGCDPGTLRAVRRILLAEGWLRKEGLRDKGGKWLTRGWTVVPKLSATDAKSPGGEKHPPMPQPPMDVATVDTTTDGKSPYTVSSILCNPPSSCTPSASTPSVPVSKQASELANDSVAQRPKTQNVKTQTDNEAYKFQLGSEYGDQAKFDARLQLVVENLHEAFGMPWITVNDVVAVCDIALHSLYAGMSDAETIKLPIWAKQEKFWSKRTPTYASLAKNMQNKTETGLIAQFRAKRGVKRAFVTSNSEETVQLEEMWEGDENVAVGKGFDVEEA